MKVQALFVVLLLIISPIVYAVGPVQSTGTASNGLAHTAREPDYLAVITPTAAAGTTNPPVPETIAPFVETASPAGSSAPLADPLFADFFLSVSSGWSTSTARDPSTSFPNTKYAGVDCPPGGGGPRNTDFTVDWGPNGIRVTATRLNILPRDGGSIENTPPPGTTIVSVSVEAICAAGEPSVLITVTLSDGTVWRKKDGWLSTGSYDTGAPITNILLVQLTNTGNTATETKIDSNPTTGKTVEVREQASGTVVVADVDKTTGSNTGAAEVTSAAGALDVLDAIVTDTDETHVLVKKTSGELSMLVINPTFTSADRYDLNPGEAPVVPEGDFVYDGAGEYIYIASNFGGDANYWQWNAVTKMLETVVTFSAATTSAQSSLAQDGSGDLWTTYEASGGIALLSIAGGGVTVTCNSRNDNFASVNGVAAGKSGTAGMVGKGASGSAIVTIVSPVGCTSVLNSDLEIDNGNPTTFTAMIEGGENSEDNDIFIAKGNDFGTGDENFDVELSAFLVVPEFSTMTLLLAGLAALAGIFVLRRKY